jgi:hypothetical protein
MVIARWEEFSGGPRKPSRDSMHVTLNDDGVLLMNKKTWETIGEPRHVVLLFDRINNMIGVRSGSEEETNSFPVKGLQQYSRIIYASPFCTHYGLELDSTMMFNEIEFDDQGVLRLMLKTATNVTRTSRRRKK